MATCPTCKEEFVRERRTQAYCKLCEKSYYRRYQLKKLSPKGLEMREARYKHELEQIEDPETRKEFARRKGLPTTKDRRLSNGKLSINRKHIDNLIKNAYKNGKLDN